MFIGISKVFSLGLQLVWKYLGPKKKSPHFSIRKSPPFPSQGEETRRVGNVGILFVLVFRTRLKSLISWGVSSSLTLFPGKNRRSSSFPNGVNNSCNILLFRLRFWKFVIMKIAKKYWCVSKLSDWAIGKQEKNPAFFSFGISRLVKDRGRSGVSSLLLDILPC